MDRGEMLARDLLDSIIAIGISKSKVSPMRAEAVELQDDHWCDGCAMREKCYIYRIKNNYKNC